MPGGGPIILETTMAGETIPHFHNSAGHHAIDIGIKEFKCMGALPPNDHPHVFLDMGDDSERVCPYCSTLYRYNSALSPTQTDPEGCLAARDAA